MSEITTINTDRHFEVKVAPCLITKQFDRCVVAKLGTVVLPADDTNEERVVEVMGSFSREGLDILRRDLESVPDPVGLLSQDEVNQDTPYQWAVVMEHGEHYQQYPVEGGEMPFSAIHLPDVHQFWIMPRESPEALPWYGLIRGKGWVERGTDGVSRPLDLPQPGEEPFEWHYYRHNVLTFAMGPTDCETLPPHVVQILGWRLPRADGADVVFEIGIERDGSWQIWKREPLDDPRWT